MPEYLTEDDLCALGLTPLLVRVLAPHAVEYTALDGTPCWDAEDLAPLLGANGGDR